MNKLFFSFLSLGPLSSILSRTLLEPTVENCIHGWQRIARNANKRQKFP